MGIGTAPVAAEVAPQDAGFKRELGLVGATWASETSIIGSGWLFGALYASMAAGPVALIGWIIGGVAVVILALCHAELGAMYPVAGGTARFPHFAFGGAAGTAFGFFSWLQAVTVAPVECFAVMQYLSWYWPSIYNSNTSVVTGLGFVLTIILLALFTVINMLGMRLFARVNNVVTWWKVAIPVLAIIVLLTKFHGGNFTAGGGFMPYGIKALFGAIPSAGIVFAYLGFEQADQLAAEVKNPQRNLPRAIIASVVIGTIIYVMLQVAFIGALPTAVLTHGWANISNHSVLTGPFAGLAGLVGFTWLAIILRVDAFISPSGTGMIYLTSTSRIGYGLAKNRYFPAVFRKVDARGVPWVSLILAFLLGIVFLFPFPSWHSLVSLVTGASVLMYAGAPLSLGAFRKQVPDAPRPYRLRGAAVLSPLAFIIANMLIYWSGLEVVWKLGIAIVIGYVIIGLCMLFSNEERPKMEWRSGYWIPIYLIGLGIISWQGQYSGGAVKAPVNTNNIPFWWDMLVVAVFSLIVYYLARYARLPREKMLSLVAEQVDEQKNDPVLSEPPAF